MTKFEGGREADAIRSFVASLHDRLGEGAYDLTRSTLAFIRKPTWLLNSVPALFKEGD